MSTRHRWADEIKAWSEGGAIQWRTDLTEVWRDWTPGDYCSTPYFHQASIEWRIKPKMCSLNGYEFPEPIRKEPDLGAQCFFPTGNHVDLRGRFSWLGDDDDFMLLRHGRIHLSKEAAIAHARAEILAVGGTLEDE